MTAPLAKIRALLALAKSSNMHEAATAAAQAQRLLTQHGLTERDLADEDKPRLFEIRVARTTWRRWILASLCSANAARCLERTGGVGYSLLARPSTADAVIYLFTYLSRTIEKLASEYTTEPVRSGRRSFRLGAAATLADRIQREHKQELQRAQYGGSSLVHLDARELELEALVRGIKMKSQRVPMSIDDDAFRAGCSAASKVALGSGPALQTPGAGRLDDGRDQEG